MIFRLSSFSKIRKEEIRKKLHNCKTCEHGKPTTISHPHLDRLFTNIAMPTQNLHSPICDHHDHIHCASRCEISFGEGIVLALIQFPGRFPSEQADGFNLSAHFSKHECNSLFLCDFHAKCF